MVYIGLGVGADIATMVLHGLMELPARGDEACVIAVTYGSDCPYVVAMLIGHMKLLELCSKLHSLMQFHVSRISPRSPIDAISHCSHYQPR